MNFLKLIRILTIIGLITLGVLAYTMKFGSCDKVKIDYNGTKISASEIVNLYTKKCMSSHSPVIPIISNWSLNQS